VGQEPSSPVENSKLETKEGDGRNYSDTSISKYSKKFFGNSPSDHAPRGTISPSVAGGAMFFL
jgi:hypothetical protein